MKLTQSLLATLSCASCFANADLPNLRKKLHHHPYDPTFEPSKAKYNLHHQPLSHTQDKVGTLRLPKRDNVLSPYPSLEVPSSPPIPNFLPPPWSPSSNLDSPYPLTGVPPYDDTGRSEVLDNEPSAEAIWRTCPISNLNCTKCPRDERCQRKGTPWWQVDPTIKIDDGGLVANVCPLTSCTTAPGGCGKNAKCVRDHCVCETGWKGATDSVRGFEGLQAVTVWVDGRVDCDVRCDGWGCEEVRQVEACFGVPSVSTPETAEATGVDDVETAGSGGGAVKVPGAGEPDASRVRRDETYCDA